jgi:putative FmdB family regulatory protein
MPIYSYKCSSCGKIFEKFKKSEDHERVFCNACGSKALRIFSPVGIIFKGKGFYSTDYGPKDSSLSDKNNFDKKADKEIKTESIPKEKKTDNTKKKEVKTQNKSSVNDSSN